MAGLHRILVLGGALPAYFEASEQEKRDVFLPRFRALLAEWEKLGAQVVASFCDDVLQVGRLPRRYPARGERMTAGAGYLTGGAPRTGPRPIRGPSRVTSSR